MATRFRIFGGSARISALGLLALAAVACSRDRPASAAPAAPPSDAGHPPLAVRDSSGIRVVEYGDVTTLAAPIRIAPTPVYRVGWAPGEREWGMVTGGTLLSGGRVAILDPLAHEVVVLDPEGAVAGTLGREGEGPGEFGRFITAIRTVGQDTIVVPDLSLGRFTLFHDGEFVRSVAGLMGFYELQRGDGRGGLLYAGQRAFAARPFEEDWLQTRLLRVDLATGAVDTVATADYIQNFRLRGFNPFAGQGHVTAGPGSFVKGRSDRAELTWVDATGAVTQILRWQPREIPLTDVVWAAYEERLDGEYERMAASPNIRQPEGGWEAQRRDRLARARESGRGPLPEFGFITADAIGRVWIGHTRLDANMYGPGDVITTADRFDVVAPDGAWLGTVDMPVHLEILDIDQDYVLGIEKNDLDVQAVALYRIER
jgi:hypothetical protein